MALQQDFQQRIASLSLEQRTALAQKLQQHGLQQHGLQQTMLSNPSAQRLVAYVVPPSNGDEPNPAMLREALKAQLPAYMVPAAIVPLPALPRTDNGKIDVHALPEPPPAAARTDSTALPQTSVEVTLAQIWQEVLGLATIGIHDNFFELGGDSILSIQIVSKAREAGLCLSPNQLFEQSTIAELAAVVHLTLGVAATQAPVTGPVPPHPHSALVLGTEHGSAASLASGNDTGATRRREASCYRSGDRNSLESP